MQSHNKNDERDEFVGEGRFLREGPETSCCLEMGMTRAATFTQQLINQNNGSDSKVVVFLGSPLELVKVWIVLFIPAWRRGDFNSRFPWKTPV